MLRAFYAQGLSDRPHKLKDDPEPMRATRADSFESSIATYPSSANVLLHADAIHEYKPAFPFQVDVLASALAEGVDAARPPPALSRGKSAARLTTTPSFSPGIFV
ncbi:hypothetical protein SPRG_03043 [Saprolegnia parasitica CBS 223.65]|uniref:Uncharacterized protein n=1 Tax=Saprolegnia parasitica (strain CBS 223.65) TaxID=695850 RepID=A0A067CPX7_SAPPC|nr:hypothetical protein SPRG_03043 [Saprolegnia parasitica CBS 223.65]KDO32568.1 hypothetical protein SPRG_03043 [Saprolegnia parasitica CBS 223.65]|eukprot:XP_012197014.1 hypothetical protein SPRG_03043 [Saprolegnia parasitica CBS 223.65]